MIYDYIIVGAGMGGLSAGLNLVNHDKNVLMLEKNSLPGGLVTTFRKGRFEFDLALNDLYDYGSSDRIGSIGELFKEYNVEVETLPVGINDKIKVIDSKELIEYKGGTEELFLKLEQITPGSINSLKEFLKITKEIHEALNLLIDNKEVSEEEYPEFYRYLDMPAFSGLQNLKMPIQTIHHLGYMWNYLSSPLVKLSFIDFADFMYKIFFKKTVAILNKSTDLAINMARSYQRHGGKIRYRSEVIDVKKENEYIVVTTNENKEYKAREVIFNVSDRYVYNKLIHTEDREANRIINARTLSSNGVVVYLGLNKSYQDLGLTNYKYYQFQNIDSMINIKSMKELNHKTIEAVVPNVVNESASPKNTCILVIKTNYYGNVFDKMNKDNYMEIREAIASYIVTEFEEAFNIDIREYIEEIEVITPFNIVYKTNNSNGSMMGYMRLGYDNMINRLLAYKSEKVPLYSFVGGWSIFAGGVDNAIKSGYYVTNDLLRKGDKDGE